MKKFFLGLFFIITVVALASFWRGRGVLHLEGEIDQDFVEQIEKFPKSRLKTIIINSPGGRYRDAIDVANLVLENDIKLIVDGRCYSACASILLPSGSDIEVRPGSIIAFHNMVGFWHYFEQYLEKNEDFTISNFQIYRDAEDVISIYRRSGINPDFFLALATLHRIRCIGVEREGSDGSVSHLQMLTEEEFYVPNEALFRQFGWKFKKAYFPDRTELLRFLEEMNKERGVGVFNAEDPAHKFPQRLVDAGLYLESVEICDPIAIES